MRKIIGGVIPDMPKRYLLECGRKRIQETSRVVINNVCKNHKIGENTYVNVYLKTQAGEWVEVGESMIQKGFRIALGPLVRDNPEMQEKLAVGKFVTVYVSPIKCRQEKYETPESLLPEICSVDGIIEAGERQVEELHRIDIKNIMKENGIKINDLVLLSIRTLDEDRLINIGERRVQKNGMVTFGGFLRDRKEFVDQLKAGTVVTVYLKKVNDVPSEIPAKLKKMKALANGETNP